MAFSGVEPFLDPDIHAGATLDFPEESPLNTLRYLSMLGMDFDAVPVL